MVKVEQSQRSSASFGSQNSSQFRFIPGQARNSASSQNHQTQSHGMQIGNQTQVKKEESKTKKIPSFEFNAVLKDVKSRLNSSKSDKSMKST